MRNGSGTQEVVTGEQIVSLFDVQLGYFDRAHGKSVPPFASITYEFGRQLHAFGQGLTPKAAVAFIKLFPIWSRK